MHLRRLLPLTAMAFALASGALATKPPEDGPEAIDPWKGKTRRQVTSLLGEPTKTKHATAGDILEYRLLRVPDDAVLGTQFMLLEVPGVGLTARSIAEAGPADAETMSIEPPAIDGDGRPVAGGLQTTVSRSVSWDSKTGELKSSDAPATAPALKKVRLTFELDRNGRVIDWSVSPKLKKKK